MQEIQQYARLGQQAKQYYDRNSTQPEVKKEEKDEKEGADFATVGKSFADLISKAKQPTFSFDKSGGVKIAGAIGNPLQPSLKTLNPKMKEYAEMVQISSTFHKKGLNAAKQRLNAFDKNYTLDTDLTTDQYAVIRKPDGKAIISFRGTDPKAKIKSGLGKGVIEPLQWILIQSGYEDIFDDHKLDKIKNKILTKYRPDQIEQITGYSMGGTKAHRLGNMMGIDTHLFNPYLGKNFFDNPITPNTKHQIVRTTEDIASSLRVFNNKKMPSNVKVDSIDPINTVKMTGKKIFSQARTDLQAFNLLDNHNLEHFTSDGDRSSLQRELNEQIDNRVNKFNDQTRGLSKNSTDYQRLQEQMIDDLKPTLKLSSQENQPLTSRAKMFNSLKPSSVITALAGIAGGAGIDKLIGDIESASGIPIDEHITTAVSGGLGALPQETVARFLGGKINFARAVGSGVAGALAQEVTAEGTNALLRSAGVDESTAEIVSQTVGGGVGGAVTAGGAGLARQLALRLAARAAAVVGAEATATAVGAEIGSIVPGFGTIIGAGIGALVSLGFAIFDHESRKNAPISPAETDYLNSLLGTVADGAYVEDILKDIDDDMERDRLRTFINDPSYQRRVDSMRQIQYNDRLLQQDRRMHGGATISEMNSMTDYIKDNIPGFAEMNNVQRNASFRRLASDPHRIGFFEQFVTLPSWDETITDNYGRLTAGSYTKVPKATILYQGQRERAREEYVNSPEYIARQDHLTWLTDKLDNDPEFVNARTTTDANRRIYEILDELAGEWDTTTRSFSTVGADAKIAQDFIVSATFAHLIPQFDDTGDMILQDHYLGPLESNYEPPSVADTERLPPPVAVPKGLYQDILTARSGSRGIVAKMINKDPEVQRMVASGDIDGINNRIRDLFNERSNVSAFGDAVMYDDPDLPQFNAKGEVVYQKMSAPAPTESVQPAQPAQPAPAPPPAPPVANKS